MAVRGIFCLQLNVILEELQCSSWEDIYRHIHLHHIESLPHIQLIQSENIVKPVQMHHPRANKHDIF